MVTRHMIHLNGHMMCAIDVETTGLRPGYHELLQVCCVPLDEKLRVRTDLPIFDVLIQPLYPERLEPGAASVNKDQLALCIETGYHPDIAFELFEEWFKRLDLAIEKRITPLAHNWMFDRGFLIEWMGWENFNYYIDGRARDTMLTACFMNDRSDFQAEQTPFPGSLTLSKLANMCDVEVINSRLHDALYDCEITRQIYLALCKGYME